MSFQDDTPSYPLIGACLIVFLVTAGAALSRRLKARLGLPLPPGPKGYPILGSALDIPRLKPWLKLQEWQNVHGDIMYLNILQQPTIVIGSADVAIELMEKRSGLYSDRPLSTMGELVGWDWPFSFQPYGPRWRSGRRCFHQYFNHVAVLNYRPVETREVNKLLRRIAEKPGVIDLDLIRLMSAAVIGDIVYGMHIDDIKHPYIIAGQEAIEGLDTARAPGAYLTEYIPILKYIPAWLPGAAARKLGNYYKPIVDRMRDAPYDEVQEDVANSSAGTSMTHMLVRHLQDKSLISAKHISEERIARDATAIAYFTAVDTALYTISNILLAMAMFPEVQQKAQAELESVVGHGRLPDFDDNLPYIQAVVMEGLRWMPVVPLGVPHRVTADDEYRGYHIPKGAMIMPNQWGMLHDPKNYPNPELFDPDRFLKAGEINPDVLDPTAIAFGFGRRFLKAGEINPDVLDPTAIAFGFGRRICPGRHLAKEMVFVAIASMLHVFDITATLDQHGKPTKLSAEATTGLISYAERVPIELKTRGPWAANLIYDN